MVATGSYRVIMNISIKEAKNKLSEVVRRAEAGERVVVTRGGKPVADVVPHVPRKGGVDLEALAKWKKENGIQRFVAYIPEDFDDPLPEDFLITPMPEPLTK
jgi:prevent-host-death family protein